MRSGLIQRLVRPSTTALWQRTQWLAMSSQQGADSHTLQRLRNGHAKNNITESIIAKVGRNLHLTPNHPLHIIKKR